MDDPRINQIRQNVTGYGTSDVYTTYSATYSWSANQIGHVFIGFGAMVVWWWFWTWLCGEPDANTGWWVNGDHGWIALVLLAVIYGAKEVGDVLAAREAEAKAKPEDRISKLCLSRTELWSDGITDWLFVMLGGFMGLCLSAFLVGVGDDSGLKYFGLGDFWLVIASLVMGIGFWFAAGNHFRPQKRCFDKSGLPYLHRIAVVTQRGWHEAEDALLRLLAGQPQLIIITGAEGTGRTSLLAGIGGDACYRKRFVRYVTAGAMTESGFKAGGESALGAPWNLSEADLLLVDDVPLDWDVPAWFVDAIQHGGRPIGVALCLTSSARGDADRFVGLGGLETTVIEMGVIEVTTAPVNKDAER